MPTKIILKNVKGRHGKDGLNGQDGIKGSTGLLGPLGPQGTRGTQGERGTDGLKGDNGKQGTTGLRGMDGSQGLSGARGVQGEQGVQGLSPAHRWKGESVQFQNPDGSWGKLVNLRGEHGSQSGTRVAGGGGASANDVVDLLIAQDLLTTGENVKEATRTDFDGDTIIYKGWAEAGSSEGGSVWRIKKTTITVDGGGKKDFADTWADGDTDYDNVWTNRASLTYI